jgi:rhodanese-related sulfurtransferase
MALLSVSYMGSCSGAPKTEGTDPQGRTTIIKAFDPKEAQQVILQNKGNPDFVLIDIRTPEEFESGRIAGATNINYHSESFSADLDKLDKSKTYMIYCRTGRRTSDTVGIMVRLGFTTIYRINGDITRWKSQGLPVVRP